MSQAKGFADLAPDSIADHGPRRYPARHRHAKTRRGSRRVVNSEQGIAAGLTLIEDAPELGSGAQSSRFGQAPRSGHGMDQRLLVAASRLRPLARRALMMARPEAVAMRARKPCRRARLSLLGWNVRFMTLNLLEKVKIGLQLGSVKAAAGS